MSQKVWKKLHCFLYFFSLFYTTAVTAVVWTHKTGEESSCDPKISIKMVGTILSIFSLFSLATLPLGRPHHMELCDNMGVYENS